MATDSSNRSAQIISRLQSSKREHRIRLAQLPIEEKVRILVQLQTIALEARPPKTANDPRMVWQIRP